MKKEALLFVLLFATVGFLSSVCDAKSCDNSTEEAGIKLILNVDDSAIHPDIVNGTIDLWKKGAVSSTSIIAYASDFEHTAQVLKEIGIPVGVHLGLHHGPGVLPAGEVPSLHSQEGQFWPTVNDTLAHMDLAEAEAEFEAQIEKVIHAGLNPTYLDSHMGLLFRNRDLVAMYVRLAKKYDLALALPAGEMYDKARKELELAGLKSSVTLNGVYTMAEGKEESLSNRTEAYRAMLKQLKPGINYSFSHPILDTESARESMGDSDIRRDDYALFMSPEWKKMLEEEGIELASFR